MKLLTINTHSLQEENYPEKLRAFVKAAADLQPDIIAMQEVNQTIAAAAADDSLAEGLAACPVNTVPLRRDNHAANAVRLLREAGLSYHWSWLSAKVGYGKYDEGMAILSRQPILDTDGFTISTADSYDNWKTRKTLGIRMEKGWFYTVHMGWWADAEEPFAAQWDKLHGALSEHRGPVWLMGDFNSPAEIRGEGYDLIAASGYTDAWKEATDGGAGFTVRGVIDGWRDKLTGAIPEGMRIDHIWCSEKPAVKHAAIVFDGTAAPVISDHFGILLETEEN